MTNNHRKKLLKKYKLGKCSAEELKEVEALFNSLKEHESEIPKSVESHWEAFASLEFRALKHKVKNSKRSNILKWSYSGVAAIILLFLGISLFWKNKKEEKLIVLSTANILPGKEGGFIKLSSGRSINLETIQNEYVNLDRIGRISKENGFYKYSSYSTQAFHDTPSYTISTPLARQTRIELPDGTKIWLNAGTTLRFPSFFEKRIRKVKIEGEAYIEVKHIDSVPFFVEVKKGFNVEDIGTSFNITAYEDDEDANVTLLEGIVKIGQNVLHSSDQWIRSKNSLFSIHKLNDPSDEIMWIKGYLNFNGLEYQAILRKISRWYNIQIVTMGALPNQHISGNIPNNMPLSNLLKILENYGLKFSFRNNTLFVSKK